MVLLLTKTKRQLKKWNFANHYTVSYPSVTSSNQANTTNLREVKRNVMIQSFWLKNNSPNLSDNILV